MAGPTFHTTAFVLFKRPPASSFIRLTLLSAEHGLLSGLHRLSRPTGLPVDLFDELSFVVDTPALGDSVFLRDVSLLRRFDGIGQHYERLRHASALANLIIHNPIAAENQLRLHTLVAQALPAFAASQRPDIVFFKCVASVARDEGLPLRQQWAVSLSSADRACAEQLLTRPVAELSIPTAEVARLTQRLQDYLRHHGDVVFD